MSAASRILRPTALGVGLLVVALAACAGTDTDEGADTPSATLGQRTAPLPDERIAIVTLTWRTGEPGLAQAYVVDHAPGERKAALDLLGASTAGLLLESSLGFDPGDGNLASPGLIADQCRVERLATDTASALLRDAGEILVATGDTHQVLDFTWLPEGSLGASGAAYSALLPAWSQAPTRRPAPLRTLRSSPYETPGRSADLDLPDTSLDDAPPSSPASTAAGGGPRVVSVTADGSHEVGPFTASTLLPSEVRLVSVGPSPVRDGRLASPLDLSALPHTGLELRWAHPSHRLDADATRAPLGELTLVVFERVGFGETWTISCATEDDGAFAIPTAALMALPDLGTYQTDRLVLRKIAGASFSARSLPEGLLLAISEDQVYLE